jgi:hypothetical protein
MTTASPAHAPAPAPAARPGRWYPELPPRLPGENIAGYQTRLTAGAGPYDHARSDDCATGRHGACRAGAVRDCQCPHHADQAPDLAAIPAGARPALAAGARELAGRYGLPEATGLRLMALTREVACGGPRPPAATLQARVGAAYRTQVSEQFTAAVRAIYHAAVTGDPR